MVFSVREEKQMNTRAGGRSGDEKGWLENPDGTYESLLEDGLDDQRHVLAQTIETEIVPRLMLVLQETGAEIPSTAPSHQPSQEDVDDLVEVLLTDDVTSAISIVERVRNRGASMNELCTELLAPAARVLGKYWESDRCTFTDVTVALCTLQQVLHHFCSGLPSKCIEPLGPEHRALLVPIPGEQHSFGLLMIVEFFRRFGWEVLSGPPGVDEELCRILREESFRVVGLSISSDDHLEGLSERITRFRRASINKDILVLVGGRVFDADPDLVAAVGADGTAKDGLQAVQAARLLIAGA